MRKKINYKVSGEEWKKAIDEAFMKLNKKAKIDGFRPGKAPRDVFEKKYGKQEILLEATDTLMQQRYKDIIEKDKIIPIIVTKVLFLFSFKLFIVNLSRIFIFSSFYLSFIILP